MSRDLAVEITACMPLFSNDSKGQISTNDIAAVIRAVGLNPTESQLKALKKTVDTEYKGKIDGAALAKLLEPHVNDLITSEEALRDALQCFDRGTTTIDTHIFSDSLCELGEPLPRNLVDEIIRTLDKNGEGKINPEDLIELLTS